MPGGGGDDDREGKELSEEVERGESGREFLLLLSMALSSGVIGATVTARSKVPDRLRVLSFLRILGDTQGPARMINRCCMSTADCTKAVRIAPGSDAPPLDTDNERGVERGVEREEGEAGTESS